jgi:drug/metabolite transporter (DMT)-like permease
VLTGPVSRCEAAITLSVFLAVMFSAALHAGWNAILKIRLEPMLAMALVKLGGTIVCLPLMLALGFPKPAAWPWLATSVAVHMCYYTALAGAYSRADMGQVYPIARGSAPMLTTLIGVFVLGEAVSLQGKAGVAMIGLGILAMALRRAGDAAMDRRALMLALATALTITAYTLSDGLGARAAGDAVQYTAALFVLEGLFFFPLVLALRGRTALQAVAGFALPGLAGGMMSFVAYAIAIWAMTQAPIPLVAAAREASVLFGAILAVIVLKEPLRANRVLGALLILMGLVLIRLQ